MNESEVIDDSTAVTSAATDTAADQTAESATGVTLASLGDQTGSTPPVSGLDEFKADLAKAVGKEPEAPQETEAEAEPGDLPKTDEPKVEPKDEAGESKALSNTEQEKVPEKLTDRPEWQAATKIADKLGKAEGTQMRGILRGIYKREYDLTQTVEKLKPAGEVVQEMYQSVGSSEVGFNNMRHLIKSYDADPAAAVPMLKMLLEDAEKRAGLVIQSPELLTESQKLEKQVEEGIIDREYADRRRQELLELQQARTHQERSQKQEAEKRQQTQRAQIEQKQMAAISEIEAAAAAWEKEKMATDPDYAPLKGLHTSRTFTLAEARVAELGRMLTGSEARAIAEEALKQVKAEVGKLLPKRTARQPINGGDGSSGNNRQQPMSEEEQFKADVARATARH